MSRARTAREFAWPARPAGPYLSPPPPLPEAQQRHTAVRDAAEWCGAARVLGARAGGARGTARRGAARRGAARHLAGEEAHAQLRPVRAPANPRPPAFPPSQPLGLHAASGGPPEARTPAAA